ncbi:uncharacterized protein LOC143583254 [Bidens hawaiensis]|uniref:uncharacterized protein LOC143583254 n=1 Tax=Bidens hawaiensis TaxID=980011 RepID=UPI004049494B
MSTPYTIIRNRVKDLISCFNACKLQVEKDEEDESDRIKRAERGKQVVTETTSEVVETQTATREGGEETHEEDDDYIVFYFKDDDRNVSEIKEVDESVEHLDTLEESSNSSTSSFAFPAIQPEWTGSPVSMPRPERHYKSDCACVQCCKF